MFKEFYTKAMKALSTFAHSNEYACTTYNKYPGAMDLEARNVLIAQQAQIEALQRFQDLWLDFVTYRHSLKYSGVPPLDALCKAREIQEPTFGDESTEEDEFESHPTLPDDLDISPFDDWAFKIQKRTGVLLTKDQVKLYSHAFEHETALLLPANNAEYETVLNWLQNAIGSAYVQSGVAGDGQHWISVPHHRLISICCEIPVECKTAPPKVAEPEKVLVNVDTLRLVLKALVPNASDEQITASINALKGN